VLARLHDEFIPGNGLRVAGTHHEIYLTDFRKVAPDKRRTILRQPRHASVTWTISTGSLRAIARPLRIWPAACQGDRGRSS
jgi:hypothetical protein